MTVICITLEAFHDDPVGNAVSLLQEMGRLHNSVGGAIVCTTLRETVIESCVAGVVHPPQNISAPHSDGSTFSDGSSYA